MLSLNDAYTVGDRRSLAELVHDPFPENCDLQSAPRRLWAEKPESRPCGKRRIKVGLKRLALKVQGGWGYD